jgi:hypothetical protein
MSLPVTAGAAALSVRRAGRPPPLLPTALAGVTAYATSAWLDTGSGRFVSVSALYRLAVASAVAVRLRRGTV